MQPNARSAEAWRVFSLAQAPMFPNGRRAHGSENSAEGEDFSLDEYYSENNGG